ncbi:uncharacterized protein LOC132385903 [Hypanus sabinus]|uniref:uncharacterized protein LOC132385903 n=1 Tax=Hypanus sabinus TaxID=79690 RepID=UPI0028C43740|nr:uncharacterized protein LOC132385903 [Hypanus sabinus]
MSLSEDLYKKAAAKRAHAQLIHSHFQDSSDTRRMWEGIQDITNYGTTSPADQLADVLTDIFNISLSSVTVPTCFKAATIVPVPKTSSVSFMNDYRLFALTSIIMQCFKRLVMRHIKTLLPRSLDPCSLHVVPNAQQMLPLLLPSTWTKRSHVVHRHQFSIQHNHPSETDWKAESTGPEHLPLQLDPRLPDWETSVSPDQVQHLQKHDTEHGGAPGLCAQSTAVHSADPRLCCNTQLEPHHQVRR